MKDKAIILDLDDTLLSTHYRQYCCINNYLYGIGIDFIDYENYFQLRRLNNLSNSNLLKSLNIDPDWENFNLYYQQNIESDKYLALDSLIVDENLLASLKKKNFKFILLSLRNNPKNSINQLVNLGLKNYFDEIHFIEHHLIKNPKSVMLEQLNQRYNIISFCGDSTSDYEAAVQLNINFVQVKTSLYLLPDFNKAKQFTDINQYFLTLT
ncbi:MAG TPA: HAD hydrolase-like protein [Ferruginibacter sp.]|nr:HAD hydrolase-like protein [Ferruginibacter sp.]